MNFPKIGSEEKTTYQIFRQWPTKNDRLKCTHHPSNSPFGAKSLLNSSSSSHRRSQSLESLPQSIGEGADAGVESRWALEMGRARVLHRCPVRRVRYRTRTSCMIGCVDVDGDEAIWRGDVWGRPSDEREQIWREREGGKKRTTSVNVNVANKALTRCKERQLS